MINPARFYGRWERRDPVAQALHALITDAQQAAGPGATVVDLGAGGCVYRGFFPGRRYVGIDFGKSEPKRKFGPLDVQGDVMHVPLRDACADVTLNMVVMEHVPEPQRVVDEQYRVLKPGGTSFMVVPLVRPVHQAPYDFFRYTRYGIAYLLTRAGYTNIRIDPTNGAWSTIHRYTLNHIKKSHIGAVGRWVLKTVWVWCHPLVWALERRWFYLPGFPVYYTVRADKPPQET